MSHKTTANLLKTLKDVNSREKLSGYINRPDIAVFFLHHQHGFQIVFCRHQPDLLLPADGRDPQSRPGQDPAAVPGGQAPPQQSTAGSGDLRTGHSLRPEQKGFGHYLCREQKTDRARSQRTALPAGGTAAEVKTGKSAGHCPKNRSPEFPRKQSSYDRSVNALRTQGIFLTSGPSHRYFYFRVIRNKAQLLTMPVLQTASKVLYCTGWFFDSIRRRKPENQYETALSS